MALSIYGNGEKRKAPLSIYGSGNSSASGLSIYGQPDKNAPDAQIAAIEAQLGEPTPDRKGLLRLTAEALGAPQYAIAGGVEELIKGSGIGDIASRVGRELVSGVPGIELGAQRKGFGQIMEEQGVGTLGSVSDIAPFLFSETGKGLALKRGGALDITGRGAIGLGLDIATDPLTYVGTPSSLFVRGSGQTGVKLAAKEALPLMVAEAGKLAPRTAQGAIDLARATARGRELAQQAAESVAGKRAVESAVKPLAADLLKNGIRPIAKPVTEAEKASSELYHSFHKLVTQEAQDRVIAASQEVPDLLWKGGRTFMGVPIPGTVGLSAATSGIKSEAVSALAKTKSGQWALAQASKTGDFLNDIKAITIPHWHIRNSPDLLEMDQAYRAGSAFITAQAARRLEESGWAKLTPERQVLLRQVREGTADSSRLTTAERDTLQKVGALLDDMRATEIIHGVVAPGAAPARRAAAQAAAEDYMGMLSGVREREVALVGERKAAGKQFAQSVNDLRVRVDRIKRQFQREGASSIRSMMAGIEKRRRELLDSDLADEALDPLLADLDNEYSIAKGILEGGTPQRASEAARSALNAGIERANNIYRSRLISIADKAADIQREANLTRGIAKSQAVSRIQAATMEGAARTGRANYFPLILDNSPEEIAQIMRNVPGYRAGAQNIESLGRFNEVRHFDSAESLLEWNRRERLIDLSIPEARILDPTQSLLSRFGAHGKSIAGKGYAEELVARGFAQSVPKAYFDLTPSPLSGALSPKQIAEYDAIKQAVAKGGTDPRFVAGLSDDGRREFLRQRISKATSDKEVSSVLNKYSDFLDYLPARLQPPGSQTFDGSVLVAFDAIPTLRGKMIPFGLAQELQSSNRSMFTSPALNRMLARWDAINNAMRTGVYSIFPSSQFRNKYSNVATGALAIGAHYLDPRLQKEMLLLRYPRLRGIIKDTGGIRTATGEFYSWDEINRAFDEAGVTIQGRAALEQTGEALTKGPRTIHKLAGTLENQDRSALGLYYIKEGRSLEETSRLVNQWQIDYSDLTQFDRDILRRVFLFPTYARKMIPNLARGISQTPGRMSNMIRLFNGRASENQDMTTWEGDAFKIRLDRDGRNLTVLTGIDLPVRQLDLLWRGDSTRTALGALGMVNPLLKFLPEYGTKVSFFTGRPMTRQESATIGRIIEQAPKGFQDWMGYKKETDAAGRAKYTFDGQKFYALFQSYALSRLVSTSDRQFRDYLNDDNWVGTFLDISTGTRFKTINLDEEQKRRVYERLRIAREKAISRGLIKERNYYQATP